MTELSNLAGASRESMLTYAGRLREMGGVDPVTSLANFPQLLRTTVSALSRTLLTTREAPGRWSVLQVLEHLADHEMIVGYRIRMILAHDTPEIQPFDQDLWAERLHWEDRDAEETLADFEAMRRRNVRLIRSLSTGEMARAGIHRERGAESVQHFVALTAGHDLAHLRQIERILGALVD